MREKQFKQGITFFTSVSMYQAIKDISDRKRVGLSEVLREAVQHYLETQSIDEMEK